MQRCRKGLEARVIRVSLHVVNSVEVGTTVEVCDGEGPDGGLVPNRKADVALDDEGYCLRHPVYPATRFGRSRQQ